MKEVAISVKDLNKSYKVYNQPVDMLKELIFKKQYYRNKEVLKNISFDILKGDVVGIIGRNGAGKSTLLKIIAGTLDKSSGEVVVNGDISAILELGTGFHPEYTGRENIIMGGMSLGHTRKDMERRMQDIIDFSELESVIDDPFKTYSSGMKSRLTFATAICIAPDIFIVDEALAAGDAIYINKCLRRIKEICESGATVLFVSHSIDMIRRLCNKAIYIENGIMISYGDSAVVCSEYELKCLEYESFSKKESTINRGKQISNGIHEITSVQVFNAEGYESYAFFQHEKVHIIVSFHSKEELINPVFLFKFMRSDGIYVTSWMSSEPVETITGVFPVGDNKAEFLIQDLLLGDGEFLISTYIFKYRERADSIFYSDPLCMWENTFGINIHRKGRPLSTFFDMPIEYIRR